MKYSRIAVKLFEREGEDVFYDPVYHGRTLKVFGMGTWPVKLLHHIAGHYGKMGYSPVIFDTTGDYPEDGFDTVLRIRDGEPTGLDPIVLSSEGHFDGYTAATIIQTLYGLDRTLTDRLYADMLAGKVKSVGDAVSSKSKYAEVIVESYTPLDEAFYGGEPPELGSSVLVNLKDTFSVTTAAMAFLILSAAVHRRTKVLIGVNDAAVLAYTSGGSAALPLITRPMKARVAVLASQYAVDSVLQLAGPSVVLYHDPDTQSVVYESNGVPPGPMRKHVHKGEGAFIYRTPEMINVEWGELPD